MSNAGKGASAPGKGRFETGIYAHLVGWGMALPEKVMTNEDLSAFVDTNDEWIQSRTGIRERRIASEKETTATLGLRAAQQALDIADVLPAELDMIICATSTAENAFPAAANLIQAGLGATRAGAFDLGAACSGFVYAVHMAAQIIRSGSAETVLVVGSETLSRVINWNDRGTCILFGDGAGAVVLRASSAPGGVLSSILRSDGDGCDLLGLPTFGSLDSEDALASGHPLGKMHMNGGEVFKFATRVISESLTQAVEQAGIRMGDLALIVPHQANARILQAAARTLKLSESLFMSNLERYGNTSAASIPIALTEAVQQGRVKPNDYIAMVGFGGGLTWAAMIVQWGTPLTPPAGAAGFIKRQRRRFSYFAAGWRRSVGRLSRQVGGLVSRLLPERGRMERLKRRVEREPLD